MIGRSERGALRGVNLGGWLVLERWMTPGLFAGLSARDETAWCVELGADAPARLRAHWNRFVTRDDFAWLAERGIEALRIPLGHWILGPPYPHHPVYGERLFPYVTGGIDALDRAFDWAREFGLRIALDLHAAPGCQNGFDNGGIAGVCDWHTRAEYVDHSVDLLAQLARRYGGHPALHAIEVLNEPRWDVPTPLLEDYYGRAYVAIRAHCAASRIAVIFHDGFRSHREWIPLLAAPRFENVWLDVHRYQCFDPADRALDLDGHLHKAQILWSGEIDAIQRDLARPLIVGEWSLGLEPATVASNPTTEPLAPESAGPEASARPAAQTPGVAATSPQRAYAQAQLRAFEHSAGWYFWSYRTESAPEWSLRDAALRGWLPERFY